MAPHEARSLASRSPDERRVYLHIGAPKTGTTYLQDRLTLNAASLADHGVHFPSRSPLVSPGLFHFRAALDLLGQDWGGEPGHAAGNWDALVKRVRRKSGTVVVSHEILAPARAEHVARAMADLDGQRGPRRLLRPGPRPGPPRRLAGEHQAGPPVELPQVPPQDPAREAVVLPRLRPAHGPGHLGVGAATRAHPRRDRAAPPRPDARSSRPQTPRQRPVEATPGDPLWLRFCEVFGIDPTWAPRDSDRTNQSLGVAETQLIRQLNRRLDRATRREASYDALIRRDARPGRAGGPALGTGPAAARRTTTGPSRWPSSWIDYLRQSGVDVVGDLRRPSAGAAAGGHARGTTRTGCRRASGCRSPSTRWRP